MPVVSHWQHTLQTWGCEDNRPLAHINQGNSLRRKEPKYPCAGECWGLPAAFGGVCSPQIWELGEVAEELSCLPGKWRRKVWFHAVNSPLWQGQPLGCRNQQVSAHHFVPWRGHFSPGPSGLEQVCSCLPATGPRCGGTHTGGPPPTSCRTRPCRASCFPPPQPGRWEVTALVTGHAAVPQDCTTSRRHPSVFQAKSYLRGFNHILPCRKRKVLLPDPPRRWSASWIPQGLGGRSRTGAAQRRFSSQRPSRAKEASGGGAHREYRCSCTTEVPGPSCFLIFFLRKAVFSTWHFLKFELCRYLCREWAQQTGGLLRGSGEIINIHRGSHCDD